MPDQDKKLVAHMQATAEKELKAKKTRLSSGRGRENTAAGGGEGGITRALRTFDTVMEGVFCILELPARFVTPALIYTVLLFCCSSVHLERDAFSS